MTKMTRKQALELMLEITREGFEADDVQEAREIITKMIAQINKQAARPKEKTSARKENERFAVQFIAAIRNAKKEVNATWIAERVPMVRSAQRATHVAKIAEEWGAVERVTIKKRTYYRYVEEWRPTSEIAEIIRKCV